MLCALMLDYLDFDIVLFCLVRIVKDLSWEPRR